MLSVEYKGKKGILIAENSIANSPIVQWVVKFNDGQIIQAPMNCFLISYVSVMDFFKPKTKESKT